MSKEYPIEQLDSGQLSLCEKYPTNPLLDTPEHVARTIDWVTYYRRNVEKFAEHYFGFNNFPYQKIMLHEMGVYGSSTVVAARASAKTYIVAEYACCYAVLYPGSLIVVASATKGQASILVSEKIKGELMHQSAVLRLEVERISTGKNDTRVEFKNGSSIIVVVGNENARGYRAHLLILDEYRMMAKATIDEVFGPYLISHPYPYNNKPEYQSVTVPTGITKISSSYYCSHWMWADMQYALASYMNGDDQFFMCLDYSASLRHGIKTKEMLLKQKQSLDLVSWQIEYCNYMVRENTKAFFTFDLLNQCRTLKNHFYPRKNEDVLATPKGLNRYAIPKKEGEVRILACDIAMVNRTGNDNSCFVCLRLLPEGVVDSASGMSQQGYKRQVSYLEAMPGSDTTKQAIRIKQLFYDFGADYCVLDIRNAGISIYDALAKIQYDESRNKEYEAWKCFNDPVIAERVPVIGAREVVYAIAANAKFNSEIAESLRNIFQTKRIELLVNFEEHEDELRVTIPEYFNTTDVDEQVFYERPYFETTALINEMVGLEYDISPTTHLVNIHEVGKATKDRYSALAYGNIFAEYLERDLLSNRSAYGCQVFIN